MHKTLYIVYALFVAGNLYAAASSSEPAAAKISTNLPSLQALAERAVIRQVTPQISEELGRSTQATTVISREKGSQKSISRRLRSILPHANLDQVITTLIEDPTYETIDAEYLKQAIDTYFGNLSPSTKIELYLELTKALAVDYFLTRNLKNPDNLPPFLHQYFKGVSIQDLIDYGRPFNIYSLDNIYQLDLDLRYLGDIGVTDLGKIHGIEKVQWLNLRNNYIGNIAPGAFNGLSNL